ncbi:MAG: UPF0489 family protein [Planctomycetota bacterium]|nr:UPF0489 family protein [Planctomycetota bacterium]MDA1211071.1 UPF0489 family protein [Planctomycetota bacterium]
MPKVLDLDLDFFLNRRLERRADDPNQRPDDEGLIPWNAEDVVEFLEEDLGLTSRFPGKVVVHHHQVFYEWRRLVESSELETPFLVCHVDAHADLGMGDRSYLYLHSDFLKLPLESRMYPNEGDCGLAFSNYLSFAIGCRWISELDLVVPSFWHDDIPRGLLQQVDLPPGGFFGIGAELNIELMHVPSAEIRKPQSPKCFFEKRRRIGEPIIPLQILDRRAVGDIHKDVSWDFVFLSHSPGYTPSNADSLIPIFERYIKSSS